MTIQDNETLDQSEFVPLEWGAETPRGGKAVMNRILKENATVPLFFGQTLIQSLRDVGYNHTTSALCEHVDNAIQAGATEVRVFFRQTGKKGSYQTDIAVFDNGQGMSPVILKVATAFGGSLNFGNRSGIGRFGMGMKTAALSISPVMDLYSWQEPGAIYNLTLDVDAIGRDRANLITLPEPSFLNALPPEVAELFMTPMSSPDKREQDIFAIDVSQLANKLGRSGTIVYMPACDRLTFAKARNLVDDAVKEMARVYRRMLGAGLFLYVNNRRVEPVDPTFSMPNARHTRVADVAVRSSRLVAEKTVQIKVYENGDVTAPITIKVYRLPVEQWSTLPRKVLKNDLRVFDDNVVSILRNDREVASGLMPWLTTRHSVAHWYRVQIDFPGELDEAFGVAANKQGVRMKAYVRRAIKDAIGGDIAYLNDEIKKLQKQQALERPPAEPSASEARAGEADPFQQNTLHSTLTEYEEAQMRENLKTLALTLKRDNETEDQALERITKSKYIIAFKHDEYWPFYDVQHRFGRVILTINTSHPFYAVLYDPVRKLSIVPEAPDADESVDVRGDQPDVPTVAHDVVRPEQTDGPSVALDLLLLSLARTQARLADASEDARKLLDNLRREWSEAYRVQLTV